MPRGQYDRSKAKPRTRRTEPVAATVLDNEPVEIAPDTAARFPGAVIACLTVLTERLTRRRRGGIRTLKQAVLMVNAIMKREYPEMPAVNEAGLAEIITFQYAGPAAWYAIANPKPEDKELLVALSAVDKYLTSVKERKEKTNGS